LFGRNQRVSCLGQKSQFAELQCGVPQGSILGSLLFSIFISDISTVIDRHLMKHVIYADDLQIYTSSQTANISDTVVEMETCLSDIQQWLCSQKLILNPKKTEFIVFSSKNNSKIAKDLSIHLCGHEIFTSSVVRNLGVMLDQNLTFYHLVNKIRQQSSCTWPEKSRTASNAEKYF
jgi:hypothetical protein